jgi:hypothetical protein
MALKCIEPSTTQIQNREANSYTERVLAIVRFLDKKEKKNPCLQ